MAFKLTSMSRLFVFPDKPETVESIMFLVDTVFLETGEKFGTAPDDWIKVQLPSSAVQGWLKKSSGVKVPDPTRPDLDQEGFVRSALIAELSFNQDAATAPNFVFADYVLALAIIETNMTNPGATPPSDAVGPLRITSAQWQDFLTNGKPFSDMFSTRDAPSAQAFCASYRMRADGRAIHAAQPAGASTVTLVDLFHAYLTDSPALAVAIQGAAAAAKASSLDQFNAVFTQNLVSNIVGKLQALVPGAAAPASLADLTNLTAKALDAALQKAFDLIKRFAPDQLPQVPAQSNDTVTPPQQKSPAPPSNLNYAAAGVPKKFQQFGDLIVARFAAAGFDRGVQIAAVANAIAESNLNPSAVSTPPERSFGLFQCNQGGGLGNGFTQAQLCDPETNIAIVIKEAKRHKDLLAANTLPSAVEAFVRDVERPANPNAQIASRLRLAQKL